MSQAKTYPLVRNLYGDGGENETALAVATVLVPGPHYPDCGRIIAGSPEADPESDPPGGYLAPIGGFSCGPEGALNVAGVLEEAARDVDNVLDAESPPVITATGGERVRRLRRGRFMTIPARCETCCERIQEGESVQAFHINTPMQLDDQGDVIATIGDKAYVHADPCHDLDPAPERPHLIAGEFQSDKYPTCPRGKVPLSCGDPMAQDLLWAYAQRRGAVDADFAEDLKQALRLKGYTPPDETPDGPTIARVVERAGTSPLDLAALRKIVAERGPCAGPMTTFPKPDVAHVTIVCSRANYDGVIRWLAACERSLGLLIDVAGQQHETIVDLAGRAGAAPWITTPIPALWFDRDGCGPDHMYLRLRPFAAEPVGEREIPASLGLRIDKGDLVILGTSMIGGGFNMQREQVAELYSQLGAWLAGRLVKRFFQASYPGRTDCFDIVATDLAHARTILEEPLTAVPAKVRDAFLKAVLWTELTPKAAADATAIHRDGRVRPLLECDVGEWFSAAR